jgi:hypothetical protein
MPGMRENIEQSKRLRPVLAGRHLDTATHTLHVVFQSGGFDLAMSP